MTGEVFETVFDVVFDAVFEDVFELVFEDVLEEAFEDVFDLLLRVGLPLLNGGEFTTYPRYGEPESSS